MRFFVKRDLDGFFGLFVDNLVQLLLIVGLCVGLCGIQGDLLYGVILPGAAISILFGNLFYAWQAHRLAKKTGRDDVTALPYGINTPSLLVFIFFVIKPTFDRTGDAEAAWRAGLLACLGSGLIELVGSFLATKIRQTTPRAALLSTLAGIAVGFISMTFALQIFSKPLVALLPLAIVLVGLFARVRFPLGLPAGLIAVLIGTGVAWLMVAVQRVPGVPDWLTYGAQSPGAVTASFEFIKFRPPVWCLAAIQKGITEVQNWGPFLSVVIPMGIFNVIGSLQNIESAEAAGDSYPTTPSMAANGLGTIVAALFGSCFPTTIYIGHPGWKALEARAGYSTLNGIVITVLGLFGLVGLASAVIPIESGAAIVLWIGIIITAQAFRATPEQHAPAVAIGLFPAIAAWGATVMMGAIGVSGGKNLREIVTPAPVIAAAVAVEAEPSTSEAKPTPVPVAHPNHSVEANGFLVHGLLLMERGYIFTCMILAAACACLIDRRFGAASIWLLIAAVFTWLGLMHAYQVYDVAFGATLDYLFRFQIPESGGTAYRADDIAIGYLLSAIFFFAIGVWAKNQPTDAEHT
ncbi:NCS2 family permease [Planctomicrobium sp. SH668]|uniref:NCS2 family permease n=1 Tax=Planctomicrobium sp. SH668 TaxID=3448126 RepID=UPI003F5BDE85